MMCLPLCGPAPGPLLPADGGRRRPARQVTRVKLTRSYAGTRPRLGVEAMKVVHPGRWYEAGVARPANPMPEPRMNMHKNARLTPQGRLLMVCRIEQEGWKVAGAAAAAGLSVRRAYEWLKRYRAGGEIERLRRARLSGPRIAHQLAMPRSTVGAALRRLGLGRLGNLDPKPPAI